MALATGVMTIADFESLPDDAARNLELVDGGLVEVPGNLPKHAFLTADVLEAIGPYARRAGGHAGPDMLFDFNGDARAPDVAYIGPEKMQMVVNRRVQPFVPDLAVEISGERDTFPSLLAKAELYVRCGVPEVWILCVEPAEVFRVTQHRRDWLFPSDAISTPVLPGFSFRLRDFIPG